MMKPSQRVAAIPPYFFARLGKRIQDLQEQGREIIRMDMASPDLPPAAPIIEALVEAARRPDAHGYSPFGGTPAFRRAAAAYYHSRFNVNLDPETEVLGLIGSKEGLFHITQAFVNPGDVVLVPDPGYPIYASAALIAGGEPVPMPLLDENRFLPDLEAIPTDALARAKLLWLNYPNNPTGATAEMETFQAVVDLARKHDFLVCHDAPYTEISFEGFRPPSILQVPGAREVALEFNSLSKTYNMAGWRLGMALGNAEAVEALFTLKSQVDTSQFGPLMHAGVAALTGDQSWLEERNAIYEERRDIVVEALRSTPLTAGAPRAALYIWARLPEGEPSSEAFCGRMLEGCGVSVTPGVAFGAAGEGYLRISLCTPTERVRAAMERMIAWLT